VAAAAAAVAAATKSPQGFPQSRTGPYVSHAQPAILRALRSFPSFARALRELSKIAQAWLRATHREQPHLA
jgi:hypothetical protein